MFKESQINLETVRAVDTKMVFEVVIVSGETDRYQTIIEPKGFRNGSTTIIDFNHNGIDSGCSLDNIREIKNYQRKDGSVLESALIGDITVPSSARMYYRDKQGIIQDFGNLQEALTNNQIKSVSVQFSPFKEEIATLPSGIKVYRAWELPSLSFLNITPGQGSSEIKRTRSLDPTNPNNQTMSKYKIGDCLESKVEILEVLATDTPTYRVSINGQETEMSEENLSNYSSENSQEDERDEDKETETPSSEQEMPTERVDEAGSEMKSVLEAIAKLSAEVQNLKEKQKPSTEQKPDEAQTNSDSAQRALMDLITENPTLANKIQDKELQEKIQRSLKTTHPAFEVRQIPAQEGEGAKPKSKDEVNLSKKYNPHHSY